MLCAVFLSALFSPLIFFGGFYGMLVGLVLLGIAYATEDTLITAMIAGVLPEGKRNFAFGLFYLGTAEDGLWEASSRDSSMAGHCTTSLLSL